MASMIALYIWGNGKIDALQRLSPISYGNRRVRCAVGRRVRNLDFYSDLVPDHVVRGNQIAVGAVPSFARHAHKKAGAEQVTEARDANGSLQTL
jgi:hypothetical protein